MKTQRYVRKFQCGQASGESLHLTDSADLPYEDFKIIGKREQEGTPTPDAPIPIRSVADDINVLDISTNWENNCSILYQADLKQNETYTIKIHNPNRSKNYAVKHSQYKDGYTNFDVSLNYSNDFCVTVTSFSINEMNIGQKNGILIYDQNTLTELTTEEVKNLNIKIQKGSKATHYSEYGKGTIEIKQNGKNLLDLSNAIVEGWNIYIENPIKETGEYSISCQNKYSDSKGYAVAFVNEKGGSTIDFFASYNFSAIVMSTTKNITEQLVNAKYLAIYNQEKADIDKIKNTLLQLEKGATTDYEPYISETHILQTEPLGGLTNGVHDSKEADGIHRRVGSIVLDGVNIKLAEITTNYCTVDKDSHYYTVPNAKADTLIMSTISNSFLRNSSIGFFYAPKSEFDLSVDEINNLLKQNPAVFNYELAEPVTEPFELPNMSSFKGTTDITTTNEIKPDLDVTYYKDLSTQNKRLEDRLTAIEEMLSTTATSAMLLDNMQNDLEKEVEEI